MTGRNAGSSGAMLRAVHATYFSESAPQTPLFAPSLPPFVFIAFGNYWCPHCFYRRRSVKRSSLAIVQKKVINFELLLMMLSARWFDFLGTDASVSTVADDVKTIEYRFFALSPVKY